MIANLRKTLENMNKKNILEEEVFERVLPYMGMAAIFGECDQDIANKISMPLPMEALHKN